jgi:SAM-dependent methyltransferase
VFKNEVTPDDRVLDLGTGTGAVTDVVSSEDIVGLDISKEMLSVGRGGIVGQASTLPFRNNTFDVVTGRSVFHHFPDLELVLRELRRVLRPGGKVVVANEPIGVKMWKYYLRLVRGRLGHLLGRSSGWKVDIADEWDTDPVSLTALVNFWEGRGIPVEIFEEYFNPKLYHQYWPPDEQGQKFLFVGILK